MSRLRNKSKILNATKMQFGVCVTNSNVYFCKTRPGINIFVRTNVVVNLMSNSFVYIKHFVRCPVA